MVLQLSSPRADGWSGSDSSVGGFNIWVPGSKERETGLVRPDRLNSIIGLCAVGGSGKSKGVLKSMIETLKDTNISIHIRKPYNVILFNDENHSMNEVVKQIQKAINCDSATAEGIMFEAHRSGRAIVYTGHLEKAELVAQILEEIRLGVKIESC